MVALFLAVTEGSLFVSSGSEAEASKKGCRMVETSDSPRGVTQKLKLNEEQGRP
jgi:hypothetical protein